MKYYPAIGFPKSELDSRLSAKHWDAGWLFAHRGLTNATNERTFVTFVLPRVGVGNSIPAWIFEKSLDRRKLAALTANTSSLACDFAARQKIGGTNLNFFYLEQFPILSPNFYTEPRLAFITPRVLELTYTSHSLAPFARDLGHDGPPFAWDEARRTHLRADLDAFYARAYGLTRDELRYILDPADVKGPDYPSETFRVLKEKEIRQHGEYRTRRLVLAAGTGWRRKANSRRWGCDAMAGSRSKRRLLDLYVAIALMDWVDMADPPDVMAQKVTKILRDDWDVAEDLTSFVEPLIPEIFKRLWANDDGLMTRASQKQGDYGPDELADFIAATAWQLREEQAPERSLLEQLIAATKLYDSSEAIKDLFDFTIRLREFAPFNAMLLHIQKPGLTHAATAQDWHKRFGRVPKQGTRPLLVLRTKGPVDFLFDILDTEGRDVPVDAFAFPTFGNLTDNRFTEFMRSVKKERIDVVALDAGDGQAGWIRLLAASKAKTGKNLYQLAYNRNHDAATRFVTVAHELAHLYLGHLGLDAGRRVPDRRDTPHALMEVEAEMAAYLVAMRNGLKPRSESYLANYKGAFEDLNLYAVTRAANAVETAMGIAAQKLWNEKA